MLTATLHTCRPSTSFLFFLYIGIWFPWMTRRGQTANSNEAFNQTESSSLRQCMDKCDTADATVKACNSIVINRDSQISDRCQLHDVAVGENNVTSTSSETSQFYNKPFWYRGKYMQCMAQA